MRAIRRLCHFWSRAADGDYHGPPDIALKIEVTIQVSSPTLCASVRAGPGADEAEQQLSRLSPSGRELSGDIRIFGVLLLEETGRTPHRRDTFEI